MAKKKPIKIKQGVAGVDFTPADFTPAPPEPPRKSGAKPFTPVEETRIRAKTPFTPLPIIAGEEERKAGAEFASQREKLAGELMDKRGLTSSKARERASEILRAEQEASPEFQAQKAAEEQIILDRILASDLAELGEGELPPEDTSPLTPQEVFNPQNNAAGAVSATLGIVSAVALMLGAGVGRIAINGILKGVGIGSGFGLRGQRAGKIDDIKQEFLKSQQSIENVRLGAKTGQLTPSEAVNAYNAHLMNIRQQERTLKRLARNQVGEILTRASDERAEIERFLIGEEELIAMRQGIADDIRMGQALALGVPTQQKGV